MESRREQHQRHHYSLSTASHLAGAYQYRYRTPRALPLPLPILRPLGLLLLSTDTTAAATSSAAAPAHLGSAGPLSSASASERPGTRPISGRRVVSFATQSSSVV
jgi:hypothetical protein